ncbi:MAG TPA: nucleotidyltransferase [Hanamia sp.]
MTESDNYLLSILQKYKPHDISIYEVYSIPELKGIIKTWASKCFIEITNSGSRAKGTAISIASDVDYLVSLSNDCPDTLKDIYNSLFNTIKSRYTIVRKQNVSVRVKVSDLEIDITPARKLPGNTNNHNLYVSKQETWKQTNIQKHINDVSQSGRLNEIKILKIWRELNQLDFPSIYLEYLLIDGILSGKSKDNDYLARNVWYVLEQLSKDMANPLFSRIVDPANSANILSDLLAQTEKNKIIAKAKISASQQYWSNIIW